MKPTAPITGMPCPICERELRLDWMDTAKCWMMMAHDQPARDVLDDNGKRVARMFMPCPGAGTRVEFTK